MRCSSIGEIEHASGHHFSLLELLRNFSVDLTRDLRYCASLLLVIAIIQCHVDIHSCRVLKTVQEATDLISSTTRILNNSSTSKACFANATGMQLHTPLVSMAAANTDDGATPQGYHLKHKIHVNGTGSNKYGYSGHFLSARARSSQGGRSCLFECHFPPQVWLGIASHLGRFLSNLVRGTLNWEFINEDMQCAAVCDFRITSFRCNHWGVPVLADDLVNYCYAVGYGKASNNGSQNASTYDGGLQQAVYGSEGPRSCPRWLRHFSILVDQQCRLFTTLGGGDWSGITRAHSVVFRPVLVFLSATLRGAPANLQHLRSCRQPAEDRRASSCGSHLRSSARLSSRRNALATLIGTDHYLLFTTLSKLMVLQELTAVRFELNYDAVAGAAFLVRCDSCCCRAHAIRTSSELRRLNRWPDC
ncbi:hypothetical protein HII31_13318 [Pseudocercospora fuligena]|uniref:Uncharacterized protein n=1 Tax=Pseudocercospora fuligena TaxID=685502 RepID=A0A8H6VEL6_9PEZI|nr:hypothetical protein HII31_13318 [Pseudocercospora fuligena]